ncbi:DUF4386 domain-containing protein [Geothrix sp. PMB-07]|uniref:DUF4386 domain-containing protein n=1 Tax=Geothrix sp. PMB-07 TaxID=3068640 RepID=UPI002741BFE4|nr:DUF4386 domain-containing protein [Geothrix sp. PMB-07]WLT29965.1 DUF4386 domain-containing protein [Geothrix sp. PMB-07]
MPSNMTHARMAGLLYLVVVLTGFFSLAYVPSQTLVPGDAAGTLNRIASSESLFRLGIAAGFLCYLAFLLLPFPLYRLLSPVHNGAALLMVAFVLVSTPISFLTLTHKLNIVSFLGEGGRLGTLRGEQLQTQVMLSLEAYRNGVLLAKIFWGLWLLPFGYLVYKSRLLPRVLGLLLMAGCFGYLIDVFARVLAHGYAGSRLAAFIPMPGSLGEISICLWLLIVGARESARAAG